LVAALALPVVFTVSARADETADRKAEIQRKKEDAKKRAAEKAAAAASAKTAADTAAADAKKAADTKAAADKAAADAKAAAEKAAADKKAAAGAGGTTSTGTGGATATSAGGTTSTSSGGTSSGGAKATSTTGGSGGTGGVTSTPLPTADIEALRKDRVDRRKLTVEQLRKRWGSLLANPNGAADLKNHSRRVAFLQRARLVAQSKKDTKSLAFADQLLTEEDERHSNAMNALREGALGGGTK
jgi:hypothetical protein